MCFILIHSFAHGGIIIKMNADDSHIGVFFFGRSSVAPFPLDDEQEDRESGVKYPSRKEIPLDSYQFLDTHMDAYQDKMARDRRSYEFIQCEAGYSHTLLLNSLGEVFSFGEGLQGQLGIGKKLLHLRNPTQLNFFTNMKEETKITKVLASGQNSAALNGEEQLWVWGGTSRGKMGLASQSKDQMEPLHVQFELSTRKHQDSDKVEEVYLEPFVEMDEDRKKEGVEYVSEFKSVKWGLDHSVLVDAKNRVYSTGYNRYGRLGHGDEKDRIKYTQIQGLKKDKIIEAECGPFHSLAVSKEGQLYTWGYGTQGRLGQGYDEATRSNLNSLAPKKVTLGTERICLSTSLNLGFYPAKYS